MTVSITNWHTADGKLREIQEVCEAFQRGDQPQKTDALTTSDIKHAYDIASGIVEFCIASLERHLNIRFRDSETYRYSRQYAKLLARILLRRNDVPLKVKEELEEWLDREPSFPSVQVIYF